MIDDDYTDVRDGDSFLFDVTIRVFAATQEEAYERLRDLPDLFAHCYDMDVEEPEPDDGP
jgi:hypothetical protein